MKRDPLRRYIDRAREAYDLAATPPPGLTVQGEQDHIPHPDDVGIVGSRGVLLRHGIDAKCIVNSYLCNLEREHGSKRAQRLVDYLSGGLVCNYSYGQRRLLRADRDALWARLLRHAMIR